MSTVRPFTQKQFRQQSPIRRIRYLQHMVLRLVDALDYAGHALDCPQAVDPGPKRKKQQKPCTCTWGPAKEALYNEAKLFFPRNTAPPGRRRVHVPEFNQVSKILAKFGGAEALAEAFGWHRATIYRWLDPDRGNGILPHKAALRIRNEAREHGVVLTAEDWEPERTDPNDVVPSMKSYYQDHAADAPAELKEGVLHLARHLRKKGKKK